MSVSFEINAEPRNDTGKGASRRLRREGLVPGIIYGAEQAPYMISVAHSALIRHLEHEAFYSHILTVDVAGNKERVVLKDLQRHPAKPFVVHLDLQRVSDKSKLRVHVPLHFIGENTAPGVKEGGAVSHNAIDVEVLCFPKDLPEYIEIDLSNMALGDSIHLSEIKLPEGVEIPALAQGAEQDLVVVTVQHMRGEAEEEAAAEEEGEESAGEE